MNEGVEIAPDVAAGAQSLDRGAGPQRRRGPDGAALPAGRGALVVSARRRRVAADAAVGEVVADLEISRAWLVDPASGREGPGEIVVTDGVLEAVTWLDGGEADGIDDRGVVVAPGFIDLHAHFREPGNEDAETVASGLAAAAHGGFTTVCLMPNTTPALDDPAVLARVRGGRGGVGLAGPRARLRRASPPAGQGETLAALGELADAGRRRVLRRRVAGRVGRCSRNALAYAGALGLPIVEHPEDATLTAGAEANDGFVATVLGLRGWPAAAEEAAVARDLAILAEVVRDVPGARLHLTHVSTAGALDLVRRAKAAGLPVTCDVTPHHLALTDEWLAGARRWAGRRRGDPWGDGALIAAPYATVAPRQSAAPVAPATRPRAGRRCSTGPRTRSPRITRRTPSVDKDVEFGLAANGISGIETALGRRCSRRSTPGSIPLRGRSRR